jgi:phosphohistidine phosphatase SixA
MVLAGAAGAAGARAQAAPLALREALRRIQSAPHVLLMRHALTEPGVGDPPGYRLEECATQRNLSAQGREQARRVGAALRAAGLTPGEVRASAWCRCRDTAELAFGRHTVWPVLNSFFDAHEHAPTRTAALRAFVAAHAGGLPPMLVTHQVNISAASGLPVAMGQIVAMPADGGPAFGLPPLG